MRPLLITGLLLAALGVFVLLEGASFSSPKEVLKIGDVKVTANERRTIPPWVGGIAIVAGLGLIATSARKRT